MSGGPVQPFVPDSLDDLVSSTEAANMCRVAVSTVYNWVSRGHLAMSGLDERRRPLFKRIDVLRCARDTRRRALGQNRAASA